MKLHLGCGDKRIENYINIDVRKETNPDIVDDISKLDEIDANSVDLIYACHVLEHFGRHEYIKVLERWYDKLRHGGVIRLSVPDLESVFKMYQQGYSLRNLTGFLYGGQTYKENYHYIGFDFKTLQEDLEGLGFHKVRKWDWEKTEHGHIDDFSQAYIPHMEKENGTLMSLNIEATKI